MKAETKHILKILIEEPESPIYKLIHKPVPENDLEYIDLWAELHLNDKNSNDIFDYLKTSWKLNEILNISDRYQLWKEIRNTISGAIAKKFKAMNFTPRIIKYASSFEKYEQEYIRQLLLYVISEVKESILSENLKKIGTEINLDKKWIFSLTPEHRLFTDGVLILEERFSSSKKDPIYDKDIKVPASAQKLFCGIELSEMDYMTLPSQNLLDFFDIDTPDYIKKMIADGNSNQDEESDFNFDDLDFESDGDFDLDNLLSKIKGSKETPDLSSEAEPEEDITDDEQDQFESTDSDPSVSKKMEPGSETEAYTNDIDYLYEEYLWLKTLGQYKDKKNDRYIVDLEENREEVKALKQSLIKQRNLCDLRLQKTRKTSFLPRLIYLGESLNLTEMELNVVKILAIKQIFSFENSIGSSSVDIGGVLNILFEDVREMIKAKRMFLKSSRLVRSNLIQLERRSLDSNFFNITITIDTKLLEYLGGEDFDIENYVEGSMLLKPKIKMKDVIIPETDKKNLLKKIENFPTYLKAKRKIDVGTHIEYGDAFVMVSIGPSGVGKTMLAMATANHLDKRLLTVNLHNYSHHGYLGSDNKGLFGMLFREAKMNDAILFFDEAEALLENRINDLLIDIEKHKGIVIFATNASFTIDEAMRRRINHIQRFDEPGPQLRKKIWENHLPANVQLSEDVDINYLALRYEINGGLIKNAVFSAIAWAAAESENENIVIKMEHLKKGASEQLQNKLFMSKLETDKVPKRGIESAVLAEKTLKALKSVSSFEKARKVLYGEWGFKDVYPDTNGTIGVFHGPSGTGKSLAAEIIAYETGRTLKIVNYAQLVSKYVGDTEKNIEVLFTKVKNDNSILLFDEADAVFTNRVGVNSAADRYANLETNVLLSMIEHHDIFVILTTNLLDNFDPAFLRRFRFTIEFEIPDVSLRKKLWKKLVPPKMPVSDNVDFDALAKKFVFTGGDIKNAVIRAASIRAVDLERSREVTHQDFVEACEQMVTIKHKHEKGIGF